MSISFVPSKDSDESRNMYTKSNNIEIIMDSLTDDIKEKLFESLLQKHQEGLEESTKGSGFTFDSADFLYYPLQKPSLSGREDHK